MILDLTTGERIVDTTDGMGDPQEDDLAHDYPEIYLIVRFPNAHSAFVEGLGDDRGKIEVLVSAGGERVSPRTESQRWDLGRWLDEETVLAVAISGPGSGKRVGADDSATLITCRVPSGDCEDVAGTTGQLIRLPSEDSSTGGSDLRGGEKA